MKQFSTSYRYFLKKTPPLFLLSFVLSLSALPNVFANTQQGNPVLLQEAPGSKLDKIARDLNSDLIKDDQLHHDKSVILVGSKQLSPHKKPQALFVQIQSARLCGAAGCTTSIYLKKDKNWVTILDSVNGDISLLPTKHHGFYDLLIGRDDKWIWNGKEYEDTAP